MGLKGGGGPKGKGNAKAGAKSAAAAKKGKAGGKGGKKGKGKGAKKKKCNKKVSQKKYDKLRDKTPNTTAVKAANTRDAACIACGGASTTASGNLAADHVVPMKQITQMEGFACMKEKDQIAVLNDKRNFRGLCGPCNSSKCAKTWNEWNGHSQKGLLPGVKGGMTQSAASLQGKLAASIAGRW